MIGCQSLNEHNKCIDEVDRLIPVKSQQKYIRTETKCSSSGTGYQTFNNKLAINDETNCVSTPIYETIVLNQSQRDKAYQECRNRNNSQKTSNKVSADTPLCKTLLKSDGINGPVYRSMCQ